VYGGVWRKYALFSGRASRREYWTWILGNLILGFLVLVIDISFEANYVLYWLFNLAIITPSLAVAVKRLHDIGQSGWALLVNLIPVAGTIIMVIMFLTDGEKSPNKYGSNPKGIYQRAVSKQLPKPNPKTKPISQKYPQIDALGDKLELLITKHEKDKLTDDQFKAAKDKLFS